MKGTTITVQPLPNESVANKKKKGKKIRCYNLETMPTFLKSWATCQLQFVVRFESCMTVYCK